MKIKLIVIVLWLAPLLVRGQGVFVYDQLSSTNPLAAGGGPHIQQYLSIGQSFTPSLTGIDFVQLSTYDANINSSGATIWLTLSLSSPINPATNPVISSTTPVFLPGGFGRSGTASQITNFFFPSRVTLIPGVTYYLGLMIQSFGSWQVTVADYGRIPGASVYANGFPVGGSNMWFSEGIVVPEPSTIVLLGLGGAGLLLTRRRGRHAPS